MNKKIIDAMTDIVEEKMEQFKSDFYKFDLETLKDYDGCFVWSVTQSHTHLELIDIFDIVEKLKKNETRRFTFMGSSSLSIGYAVNHDAECFKSDIYLYDGVALKPISATPLNALLTVIEANVKSKIRELFPDEIKYWGKHVPIRFNTPQAFSKFMQIARSEEGEKLLKCVRNFRNWMITGVSERVMIGIDFAPKSFTFWTERDYECGGLNGGIIYHEHIKDWSTHT